MATFTLFDSYDMSTSYEWYWEVTSSSSTQVRISGGANQQVFSGSFTYDSSGNVFGTCTSSDYYVNDVLVYTVTGMNANAQTLQYYCLTSGNQQATQAYVLSGNDTITGTSGNNVLLGYTGNDLIYGLGGDNTIDGGTGTDTAIYSGQLASYTITRTASGYTVSGGGEGDDTLSHVESLKFSDKTVKLTIQSAATTIGEENLKTLEELYVAFFNRVPDADGLEYWIGQVNSGQSINQIAEAFYNAGVQYSSLTGFSSTMSHADFVNVVYKNVLGRTDGADAEGLAYWSGALANGSETHGSLVSSILGSAHTFKGDATWGWVADLLDNKIAVADRFAVDWGLNYNTPSDSITQGMAIAAAVTPTSTTEAIALIGVPEGELNLL